MIGRLVGAIRPGEPSQGDDNGDEDAAVDANADGNIDGPGDVEIGDADGDVSDVPFLSPEERILLLLSENDGRLYQQEVVAQTDYSQARVSELLSALEADGRVNRYWSDGTKVVTFPEFGPD